MSLVSGLAALGGSKGTDTAYHSTAFVSQREVLHGDAAAGDATQVHVLDEWNCKSIVRWALLGEAEEPVEDVQPFGFIR